MIDLPTAFTNFKFLILQQPYSRTEQTEKESGKRVFPRGSAAVLGRGRTRSQAGRLSQTRIACDLNSSAFYLQMFSRKHWEHLRLKNSIVEEALCGLIRWRSRGLAG